MFPVVPKAPNEIIITLLFSFDLSSLNLKRHLALDTVFTSKVSDLDSDQQKLSGSFSFHPKVPNQKKN